MTNNSYVEAEQSSLPACQAI